MLPLWMHSWLVVVAAAEIMLAVAAVAAVSYGRLRKVLVVELIFQLRWDKVVTLDPRLPIPKPLVQLVLHLPSCLTPPLTLRMAVAEVEHST
jgi:hypothetical protein